MKAKRHDDFTLGKAIPILINCPLYSGLNLNQDKATKPQTVQR
ncbi:transposase [Neisseria macacae ATCC 33926]|uniref:Transposase n=1 Tax=Neisseria macacae ATCC 33926 TaxID=997348 RepID=A0AA36UJB5_9NEIS|nr:transposase [Neisseria macacae ATCC 33926]